MLVAAARRVSRAVAPLPGRILLSEAFFATRSLSAAAKTEPYYDRKGNLKDPSKPKAPKNAFACFVSMKYESLKASLPPGSPASAIMKEAAKQWSSSVDAATQAECQRLADADRARYQAEMSSYTPPDMPRVMKRRANLFKKKKEAKERGEKLPKQAPNKYARFV